ncbi:S-adenosyl-L-methionine-dependent methyltransferase [Mycena kentingensis (nom. inval.)]|nr:S-adenosyl-L-methionine-dependent methyltransferase [Mycena kentingensis (nom. inval.)]
MISRLASTSTRSIHLYRSPPLVLRNLGGTLRQQPMSDPEPPVKRQRTENPSRPQKKHKFPSKRQKRKLALNSLPEPCSHEDILWQEIKDILGEQYVETALKNASDRDAPFEKYDHIDVQVVALSSTGTALATCEAAARPWVVVFPFGLPGETIRVKVYQNGRLHSLGDFVEVLKPNPDLRDESRVQCQYFGKCGGCQYQMLSYEKQLEFKRDVVVKAYEKFSHLPGSAIPPIESTMPSPLQYGYRTKITPHFEAPHDKQRNDPDNPKNDVDRPAWFKIGMNEAGSQRLVDIEDCQIASPTIREALPKLRANVIKNLYSYKRGVSLILRESLPIPASNVDVLADSLDKVCITDHRGTVREKVGSWLFEYPASSFFQNNNAVLLSLTSYVESRIFADPAYKPTHLVDAYCGAGLFAITLSPRFEKVAGIELSSESIRAATRNAVTLNNIPESKISFRAGDAKDIFAVVQDFPRPNSVLVIDPPRKGCDESFIEQMLTFRAKTVVYVSCNVHTQARDIGIILKRSERDGSGRYVMETLRGFDLFPQTAHVESVAVLRWVDTEQSDKTITQVQ